MLYLLIKIQTNSYGFVLISQITHKIKTHTCCQCGNLSWVSKSNSLMQGWILRGAEHLCLNPKILRTPLKAWPLQSLTMHT